MSNVENPQSSNTEIFDTKHAGFLPQIHNAISDIHSQKIVNDKHLPNYNHDDFDILSSYEGGTNNNDAFPSYNRNKCAFEDPFRP